MKDTTGHIGIIGFVCSIDDRVGQRIYITCRTRKWRSSACAKAKTDRRTDRRTVSQSVRQTDRQTERHTEKKVPQFHVHIDCF